jgi:hypothetical protein
MGTSKYSVAISAAIALMSEPPAAQTTGTAVMPFSEFVNSLSVEPADAYVGRPGTAVKTPAAFEEMRHHLLNLYSGASVAHSFVSGERIFDCIPIEDQPGVRLRKLKTGAEPPPSPPAGVSGEGHESGSPSVAEVQDAGGRDALGNAQQCEDGTIPVRRLTLEELTRFATLKDYLAKQP